MKIHKIFKCAFFNLKIEILKILSNCTTKEDVLLLHGIFKVINQHVTSFRKIFSKELITRKIKVSLVNRCIEKRHTALYYNQQFVSSLTNFRNSRRSHILQNKNILFMVCVCRQHRKSTCSIPHACR